MSHFESPKVNDRHRQRNAYLYVRQSSLRQVLENNESTQRQYALQQRALALGWPAEQIIVIDSDLGQSGASAADREGFQRLVTEVGMGRAGLVLGLEVSRLARNSTDWHRLLEICALTDTLLLDEDGVYDPSLVNDRLLLGLKGAMSEAELFTLRARLQGGLLNKARRGALELPLPVGLVYDAAQRVALDPDQQVQESLRFFFATFHRVGTACAVLKVFRQQGLLFPRRLRSGPRKGELVWGPLTHTRAVQVLHNPRYAGAFVFGRSHTQPTLAGKTIRRRPSPDQWDIRILNAHPGYITWEEFEAHRQRLRESARRYGHDRRQSPPREGPALLQGLVVCGRCGARMTVRYHQHRTQIVPQYMCQKQGIERGERVCQTIPGADLDRAVGDLLIEVLTPVTLEVALTVQQELQSRLDEADHLRQASVERARYEADLAQRRYLSVDPAHRLVAATLEADWNQKLQALAEAQDAYEQQRQADRQVLSEEQRAKIFALAADFPKLWRDPQTPDRERKRMVHLLVEDVTLIKATQLTAQIRFKGGATRTLTLPLALAAWQKRQTRPEIVAEVDRLLDHATFPQIAAQLNARGWLSGEGKPFNSRRVARIQREYDLKTRYDRLRARGLLTLEETAKRLGICTTTVKIWHHQGLLCGYPYNGKNDCLYEDPGPDGPRKAQGVKFSRRLRRPEVMSVGTHEVQYEV